MGTISPPGVGIGTLTMAGIAGNFYEIDLPIEAELLETTHFGTSPQVPGSSVGGRTYIAADFGAPIDITVTVDTEVDDFDALNLTSPGAFVCTWVTSEQLTGNCHVMSISNAYGFNDLRVADVVLRVNGLLTIGHAA